MNLLGIFLLSTLIEGLITYLFGKTSEETPPRPWLKYVSLAMGIALAIAYKVDILAIVAPELVPIHPVVGYLVSGLIMGRGANYLNDIIALIKAKSI